MYVYAYICIHICMYIHHGIDERNHDIVYRCMYMYVYRNRGTKIWYVCMYVCMCMYVYVYVFTCICVCIFIHLYIDMYIHIYI
jgi:hypothetical protein